MAHRLLTDQLTHPAPGAAPALDIAADLPHKPGYTLNSWFVTGHFEADGHALSYLVHLFALSIGPVLVGVDCAASITDRTSGWYGVRHGFHCRLRARVGERRLLVRTPHCALWGTLDEMHVRARIEGGCIDVTLKAVGHPLYNKGTGRFDMLGMDVFQYSVPTLETSGRLEIDGRVFRASGESWFDRQWQRQPLGPPRGRWTWMGISLSNGWQVSAWEARSRAGTSHAWVTVVDGQGRHTVAALAPLGEGAGDYWLSPRSGCRFPTRWRVDVAALDMRLDVVAQPREQEVGGLHARYEGASAVHGTVQGAQVHGHCYVEMVGDWRA